MAIFWWGWCERSIGTEGTLFSKPHEGMLELPCTAWRAPSPPVQPIGLREVLKPPHLMGKTGKTMVIPCYTMVFCVLSIQWFPAWWLVEVQQVQRIAACPLKPLENTLLQIRSGKPVQVISVVLQLGHFLLRSPSLVLEDATKKECCDIRQGRVSAGLPSENGRAWWRGRTLKRKACERKHGGFLFYKPTRFIKIL